MVPCREYPRNLTQNRRSGCREPLNVLRKQGLHHDIEETRFTFCNKFLAYPVTDLLHCTF